MIRIKSDKIIANNSLFDGYIYIDNGTIKEVSAKEYKMDTAYDYTGFYLSAGFIDMHTHGGGGFAFNGTETDIINGCDFHLKHGTTSILPTVATDAFSFMANAVINIEKAKGKTRNHLLGAHLEGPYLSKEQCGAQNLNNITLPKESEYKPLVESNGKSIMRWTYAPENDTDGKFCRFITDNGIIASVGHSNATYKDMRVAVDNGCNLVTHLYSCTSTVTRDSGYRSLGVIESAFLLKNMYAEIIADGVHLPPELIQMIVQIKGAKETILCTDSLAIAGSEIKEGIMSGVEFVVEDGVCKLKDRTAFAGSIATADRLIYTLVKACGYSIPFAVSMLTETPAQILRINKGVISKGKDADIVVFDSDINIKGVFVGGGKVY